MRFLLDEHVSPRLRAGVLRQVPSIDILLIGESEAPARGTLDPDVLRYLESSRRLLITANRASMPGHVASHLREGGHHWGILRARPSASMSAPIESLVLIWEASEAEEWVDHFGWVPF